MKPQKPIRLPDCHQKSPALPGRRPSRTILSNFEQGPLQGGHSGYVCPALAVGARWLQAGSIHVVFDLAANHCQYIHNEVMMQRSVSLMISRQAESSFNMGTDHGQWAYDKNQTCHVMIIKIEHHAFIQ